MILYILIGVGVLLLILFVATSSYCKEMFLQLLNQDEGTAKGSSKKTLGTILSKIYFSDKKERKDDTLNVFQNQIAEVIKANKQEHQTLLGKLSQIQTEINEMKIELMKVNQIIVSMRTELASRTVETPKKEVVIPKMADHARKEVFPILRYASFPNSENPYGFRNDSSSLDTDMRNRVFEISIIDPVTAVFRILDNADVHLEAMSNYDLFLERTCVYDLPPKSTNQAICNIEDGRLRLVNNVWKIEKCITIKFV